MRRPPVLAAMLLVAITSVLAACGTSAGTTTTTPTESDADAPTPEEAAVQALCDADAAWIAAEDEAVDLLDSGDPDDERAADALIDDEARAAYEDWLAAVAAVQELADELEVDWDPQPLIDESDGWFEAARDGGAEAYFDAEITPEGEAAYDPFFDWMSANGCPGYVSDDQPSGDSDEDPSSEEDEGN